MARLYRWTLKDIVETIVLTLLNKYDAIILIEGNRGCGKSTISIILSRRISFEFARLKRFDEPTIEKYWNKCNKQLYPTFEDFIKKIWTLKERDAYRYKIKRDTIYTRDKVIKFFNDWNRIAVADEIVLSAFNRDFYSEDQKNLIKIINTNRDHENLLFGCLPSFNVLDTQMKGLTKMRLSVIRRGLALIHTPNNKSMFSSDHWDTAYNMKLEQEWIKKKVRKPPYGKLTTVRGVLAFPDLPESIRSVYEEVKKEERNLIAKEEYGVDGENKEKIDPVQKLAIQITTNGIRSAETLRGYALALDIKEDTLRSRISRAIQKMGKDPRVSQYYWDKGKKDVDKTSKSSKKLPLMERIRNKKLDD